jgi:hypothetical protein
MSDQTADSVCNGHLRLLESECSHNKRLTNEEEKMNKNCIIIALFIGLTTLTGCVSPEEQARRAAAYQAQQEAIQVKIHEGWPKLQKGMSAQQVYDLLGGGWPINAPSYIDNADEKAGYGYGRTQRWTMISPDGGSSASWGGLIQEIRTREYKLQFNGDGLATWTLYP